MRAHLFLPLFHTAVTVRLRWEQGMQIGLFVFREQQHRSSTATSSSHPVLTWWWFILRYARLKTLEANLIWTDLFSRSVLSHNKHQGMRIEVFVTQKLLGRHCWWWWWLAEICEKTNSYKTAAGGGSVAFNKLGCWDFKFLIAEPSIFFCQKIYNFQQLFRNLPQQDHWA